MSETAEGAPARAAELAAGLAAVEGRVTAACAEAGRARSEVTLVVVTKFFPARDVRLLVDLGVRDLGESRAQEALGKLEDPLLASVRERVATHFIGQVQTNKAAAVVGWADLIHTVDRSRLVRALARAAEAAQTCQSVLVQVSLEPPDLAAPGEPGERGGIAAPRAAELADLVAQEPTLRLAGVMAVAPREGEPDEAFTRLAEVSRGIREAHPDAVVVSAGMSGDLETAVRHGATHLRVGSAILGSRPAVR
ncbi:YggS family pyridoxal phosphate-dependent enzyme [Dermatophilaceae bacterium Soc4.6]